MHVTNPRSHTVSYSCFCQNGCKILIYFVYILFAERYYVTFGYWSVVILHVMFVHPTHSGELVRNICTILYPRHMARL